MLSVDELRKKSAQVRLDSLNAICKAGRGCTGSAMSVVEILVSLYYGEISGRPTMRVDKSKPGWEDQDYLILSKGHAVPVQYSILADLGFFDKSELGFLGQRGALLKERPNGKIPGITSTILSYAQGLSVAVGLALALKMDRKKNFVYAVLGDGELQCGQIWEAATAAAHYNLNNLIVFVDNNEVQAEGLLKGIMDIGSVQNKFEAFGWQVIKVTDGHDFDQILDAVNRAWTSNRKPVCVWCKTVSGWGIDFAERKANYHSVPLSASEMAVVSEKFKKMYDVEIG